MEQETVPYKFFSEFLLRTPFFPYSFFQRMTGSSSLKPESLREICEIPEVQEAIRLASPSLFSNMNRWLNGTLDNEKQAKSLPLAVLRYLTRMSTRPTPFGIFAGFTMGAIGDEMNIRLSPPEDYQRHTRLDMEYLCRLGLELSRYSSVREAMRYYPNTSIYRVGDRYRYVEYRFQGKKRIHHIVAVDYSHYLQKVLDCAKDGRRMNDLAELLVDDEITMEEAREYIIELIDSQVLTSDLEVSVTGPEFLGQVIEMLEGIAEVLETRSILVKVQEELSLIDASPIGATVNTYDKIQQDLKDLPVEFEPRFLFQTDMMKPAVVSSIDHTVMDDIKSGFILLNRMTPKPLETTLDRFRDMFFNRFETREVPLLLALDQESGIGYPPSENHGDDSPLVEGIAFLKRDQKPAPIGWSKLDTLLLKKLIDFRSSHGNDIVLTEDDFEALDPPDWNNLPDTMATMVRMLAESGDNDNKLVIYMSGVNGPGAANLLGRFCHTDQKLLNLVWEIAHEEERLNPGKVVAEIVHLPESRAGNILLRPVIRPYEIPYLARSTVKRDFQIHMSDLFLSIRKNRLFLRSRKLDCEVIPRLSTAHNYARNATPVYQFLCDLQLNGKRPGVYFSWGSLGNHLDYLPRVTFRNIIFSFARWRITGVQMEPFYKEKDDRKLLRDIDAWREDKQMPHLVFLEEGDNTLVLDLRNIECVRNLLSEIKGKPWFTLIEFLYDPDSAVVRHNGNVFLNEFVFSFYRDSLIESASGEGR